ncbi:MAG: sensor histidine kinase [Verrucomicrobia bacterium]|nr:sensor histidine kinase [Verrucomicrobiota bacterium]
MSLGITTSQSKLIQKLERCPRPVLMLAGLIFSAAVGVVDYLTGFEIFFSVFYLLGVGVATWFIGPGFGLLMSALSVMIWIVGDAAAGAHYSSSFIPIWNAAILLGFYCVVVWLLARLRSLNQELENRVLQRTVALVQEMAERERLEKEILEVSEREQLRIGRDLHDSLCQHLTGTALAGQVLEEKLAAQSRPEAADASKVVELVEDGIALARNLARGIAPVEIESAGALDAFRELAANITRLSKITCVFASDTTLAIPDAATATHLYRIAQEAVSNAIRHGKARRIDISLASHAGRVTLTVEDDGVGLPESWQAGPGLGTRIMAHRAAMIGAEFSIEPNPTGGTLVKCSLPAAHASRESNA